MINQDDRWREQVLASYGDELVPGSEAFLKAAQPTLWNSPPGAFDQKLAELLASPAGARLKNPRFRPPDGETPVEATLRRLPLSPEARAELARTKHVDWALTPDGLRARHAAEFVRRPENHRHLADPPGRPARELRMLDIFRESFNDEVPLSRRETLAVSWGREFGHLPEHEAVRAIARRLSIASAAAAHGCGTIEDKGDPRLRATPAPTPEPARDERGRFVETSLHGHNPF
jgi:hypothetical protein